MPAGNTRKMNHSLAPLGTMPLLTLTVIALGLIAVGVTGCGKPKSAESAEKRTTADSTNGPPLAVEEEAALGQKAGSRPDADGSDTANTDAIKAESDVPEHFAVTRFEIEALEAAADFGGAMRLCREASQRFTAPEQQTFLKETLSRLDRFKWQAKRIINAARSLEPPQADIRAIAWGELAEAGDVGKIYLGKAVRQSTLEVAAEAALRLHELQPSTAVDAILDRLEKKEGTAITARFLHILTVRPGSLDWKALARLCDISIEAGPHQPKAVATVLDVLVQSVPRVPVEKDGEDAPTGDPAPALEKLATTTRTELQPHVVQAILMLLERYPPAAAPGAQPKSRPAPAEQTVMRGLHILKSSGYACIPQEALARLRKSPSADAARHLADLLQSTTDELSIIQLTQLANAAAENATARDALLTVLEKESFRLTEESLCKLCDIAAEGDENRTASIATLLETLASWVTPKGEAANDKEVSPDFSQLRHLMGTDLQRNVATTLISLLERAAVPAKQGEFSAPEAMLARARLLLLESRLPQFPGLVISRLEAAPPRPVADMLIGLLKKVPGQVDTTQIGALCELSAQDTPLRSPMVTLIVGLLEWAVGGGRPVEGQPDQQTAPSLDRLAYLTPDSLQQTVVDTLIAFLADHATKDQEAAKPDAALAMRARELLTESGYRTVAEKALARLNAAPAVPVAERLATLISEVDVGRGPDVVAGLVAAAGKEGPLQPVVLAHLRKIPGELSDDSLTALCGIAAEPSACRTQAMDVLLAGLEWSVGGGRAIKDKPDQTTSPELKQLPQVCSDALQKHVVDALIAFLADHATKDREAATSDAALAERVRALLVSSDYRSLPGKIIGVLKTKPAPVIVIAMGDILQQVSGPLPADMLAELSSIASQAEGPARQTLAELVVTRLKGKDGASSK